MKIQQKLVVFFSLFFVFLLAGCSAPQDPIETINDDNVIVEDTDTTTDTTQSGDVQSPAGEVVPGQEQTHRDMTDVVARVNGEEIIAQDVAVFQQNMMMQGQEVSEDMVLNQVIGEVLLSQEVQNLGIEISDEEVEEVIESQLAMQGLTLEEYKEQVEMQGASFDQEFQEIKQSLAVQAYIDSLLEEANFEVTQEEIQEYYELARMEMGDELPSLEEVESQIVQMIETEFQQQIINEVVTELQEDADIEFS
ncbi:MAG: SurA N-terminal domain-containing protein [Candidatus Woesearchaeota archaeon]